jgi:hypothetical protein
LESGELGFGVKNAGDIDLMPLCGIYKPDFSGRTFTSTENLQPISLLKPLHCAKKRAMAYRNERFDTALLPFGKPAKFVPP